MLHSISEESLKETNNTSADAAYVILNIK